MKFEEKIKFSTFLMTIVLLILAQLVFLFQQNWFSLALTILALILVFLPSILDKKLSVDYPNLIITEILVFIYLTALLGSLRNYYEEYWWWDMFMHLLAGLVAGAIGFLLVLELTWHRQKAIKLNPVMIVIFAFTFSVSIGVFWEIVEFTSDSLLLWFPNFKRIIAF